jgi:hypothetical protein
MFMSVVSKLTPRLNVRLPLFHSIFSLSENIRKDITHSLHKCLELTSHFYLRQEVIFSREFVCVCLLAGLLKISNILIINTTILAANGNRPRTNQLNFGWKINEWKIKESLFCLPA